MKPWRQLSEKFLNAIFRLMAPVLSQIAFQFPLFFNAKNLFRLIFINQIIFRNISLTIFYKFTGSSKISGGYYNGISKKNWDKVCKICSPANAVKVIFSSNRCSEVGIYTESNCFVLVNRFEEITSLCVVNSRKERLI